MIYLRFEIAGQIYVLTSEAIVEVIPFLPVKNIAHMSPVVAGMLNYRGQLIPVIDLAMLFNQQPSAAFASTRIAIVNYHRTENEYLLLALIAEQATETMKLDKSDFTPEIISNDQIPYSGAATLDNGELIYCLEVEKIIPPAIGSQLYPQHSVNGEPKSHVD